MLGDQRVEAVLAVQGIAHARIDRQQSDTADAPVERLALVHQAVEIHRLVRPMKSADAEMDDADRDAAAVVRRAGDILRQHRESLIAQFFHDHLRLSDMR